MRGGDTAKPFRLPASHSQIFCYFQHIKMGSWEYLKLSYNERMSLFFQVIVIFINVTYLLILQLQVWFNFECMLQ